MHGREVEIVDVTVNSEYEKFLYTCFVLPFQNYRLRQEYLKVAVPLGFHKKVRKEVGCSPCRDRSCNKLTCLKAIEVEDVFKAIREILHITN